MNILQNTPNISQNIPWWWGILTFWVFFSILYILHFVSFVRLKKIFILNYTIIKKKLQEVDYKN